MSRIENNDGNANSLDGLTILRFVHAYESGGGMEQHLQDLDKTLLERNKLCIIKMYLSDDTGSAIERTERIGRGTLIKIPLDTGHAARETNADSQNTKESKGIVLKNLIRDWVVYNPLLYRIIFKNIVKNLSLPPGAVEALNARQEAERLFKNFKIDLVIMHHIGGKDSEAIINVAKSCNVPYVFLNHFSNDRFNHMSIREQVAGAAGIAGISSVDVPGRLKNSFVNLSNGIDMEIFKPENARPVDLHIKEKVVILPARIVVTKGQGDLIKACATLKKQGLRFKLVLAGRSDSLQFEEQLKSQALELEIIDDVLFVGQLNREQLRDWYGASDILAFPTYHHEGLGRILIEAQAMEVPPIVYNVGGTSEGILQGKTGYLVPKGDLNLFIKNLRELLTNEDKRKKMGKEGMLYVHERFSLEALAGRHEQYYLRIIKDKKKKA